MNQLFIWWATLTYAYKAILIGVLSMVCLSCANTNGLRTNISDKNRSHVNVEQKQMIAK